MASSTRIRARYQEPKSLTIAEVNQIQPSGAGRLLQFLKPYVSSPLGMAPRKQMLLGQFSEYARE